MLVVVKCLPQVVDRLVAGLSTGINKDANLRLRTKTVRSLEREYNYDAAHLKHSSDGMEQPTVRVDLLLILCLQNKDDLNWNQIIWVFTVRQNELGRGIDGELRRVL